MSEYRKLDSNALDRHITGNYGEDQFIKDDSCLHCQSPIEIGQPYFTAENGSIHESCFMSGQISEENTAIDIAMYDDKFWDYDFDYDED